MTGAQKIIELLKKHGVKYVVGYTGGAIMPFFDEMLKADHFKFIMSRNEQGAAFIAQGISRGSMHHNDPQTGVCISTSGPGAMNMVTGIADAYMDSIPLIAISGQVVSTLIGSDAFQENDVVGVMMPITKHTFMAVDPDSFIEDVEDTMILARTGRFGPVNIDVPKNIQITDIPHRKSGKDTISMKQNSKAAPAEVGKAIKMINCSARPVVLCGHGITSTASGEEFEKFVTSAGLPVAFTLHGLGAIDKTHQLSLGMMGMHGTLQANRAIMDADLLIALGMRFDDRVTGKLSEYAKTAKVIHVEIDPSEIDKNVTADLAINSDINYFLNKVNSSGKLELKARTEWHQTLEQYKKEYSALLSGYIGNGKGREGKILMKKVISELSEYTHGDDILVSDVGLHQMICARHYQIRKRYGFHASGGAGTMGAGLPIAIGVKLVNPEEKVWCVVGDGGMQMNIQELGVLMEYKVPVKILLMNNGYLGMVKQWQNLFFDGRYLGTPMQNPDYGKLASGYGISYRKVTEVKDIREALIEADKSKEAFIVEFVCDPSEIDLPMVPPGVSLSEMLLKKP
jgi:acetolactate synthase-1/2/3 large subunit